MVDGGLLTLPPEAAPAAAALDEEFVECAETVVPDRDSVTGLLYEVDVVGRALRETEGDRETFTTEEAVEGALGPKRLLTRPREAC